MSFVGTLERRKRNRIAVAKYLRANKGKRALTLIKNRAKVKREALAAYSKGKMCCKRCKIADPDVLALDHINDNGASERRKSVVTYWSLKQAGWPIGLQVLCCNCNWKKEVLRRRKQATTRFNGG